MLLANVITAQKVLTSAFNCAQVQHYTTKLPGESAFAQQSPTTLLSW